MRGLSERYVAAAAAIDAANGADPTAVAVRGSERPLALAHGELAADWIARLVPDAPETWLLAARAHHLRRWELPRSSYPEGRGGYLRWRRDQKQRHASDVAAILRSAGYGDAEIAEVQALIKRDRLGSDPGAQAIEDGACLAFVETQLADMAGRLEHDHLVEVLRKTARKLSPAALGALGDVPLGAAERAILSDAFGAP